MKSQITFQKNRPALVRKAFLAITSLAAVSSVYADATWVGGTSSDYNNAANWSSSPSAPSGNLTINGAGTTPVITATPTWSTVDIIVGGGTSGRLDQTAGTLSTGAGNWFLLGFAGATGTYNLANTAGSGGTYTGFGMGSGSLNVAGNWLMGLDSGTTANVKINTSGTVTVGGGASIGGAGASNGTFNLDNGAVTVGGEFQLGASNPYGQGAGTNVLNVSGGSITADIVTISRGSNNTAVMHSTANLTGGSLNSNRYFTLGFAGSATNTATLNNSGGTININTAGGGHLEMGVFDPTTNTFTNNSGNVNLDNNASILYGSGGNHSGASTFTQNGGNVTFYSDAGSTVGGTGVINLGQGGDTGTYIYNLNGGTLTANAIQKSAAGASGTFNFNGGTLKAAKSNATFMTGLTSASVKSGGAIIDSNSFSITIGQALTDGGGGGGLAKNGAGTLTLGGANTYTGATSVNGGTLALAATGSLASTSYVIANGATFDTSAKGAFDLSAVATTIDLNASTGGFFNAGGGALTFGNSLILDFSTASLGAGTTYNLFDFGSQSGDLSSVILGGSFSGSLARSGQIWSGSSGGFGFSFDESNGVLTTSAVPEPATCAALFGALALGVTAIRRRRRG